MDAILPTSSSPAPLPLLHRATCGDSPTWSPTTQAYRDSNADVLAREWWNSQPQDDLSVQLASSFGDQRTGFACGINKIGSCVVGGCADFEDSGDPAWPYLVLTSLVNLNSYFNAIHSGINAGQLDFTNEIPHIISTFFPPKDDTYAFGDAVPWMVGAFGMIAATGAVLGPAPAILGIAGIAALSSAGVEMAGDRLDPGQATGLTQAVAMNDFVLNVTREMNDILEDWAGGVFEGGRDAKGSLVFDYLVDGTFVNADIVPQAKDIRRVYTTQFVSRFINSKMREQMIYAMCNDANADDNSGPLETRYYSDAMAATCYIYWFLPKGDDNYELRLPQGLEQLNGTYFDISGSDMTEASVGAFQAGSFEWNTEIETAVLQEKIALGAEFSVGSAWPGTWTFPVCHTGARNWQNDLGEDLALPCCCGNNCEDTATFVAAANLKGHQAFIKSCRDQLNDTDLEFEMIDYGYDVYDGWWNKTRLIAVIAGTAGGVLLLLIMCCYCCCC